MVQVCPVWSSYNILQKRKKITYIVKDKKEVWFTVALEPVCLQAWTNLISSRPVFSGTKAKIHTWSTTIEKELEMLLFRIPSLLPK